MNRTEILEVLNRIFADVLELDSVALTDYTTASDIEEWDSLSHLTLICEIENEFSIKFPMKTVLTMKNVGELVDTISTLIC